jgi:hypothetical protein
MDAYYYGFDETGCGLVDKILSAVACAGKAYHHTENWSEEASPWDDHSGETPVDWIQKAAQEAADRIEELQAKLDLSEGALGVALASWRECQRILEQTEAKLTKSEALLAKAVEALGGIEIYGSDTLSGRADGLSDATWYRDGVREMRSRARTTLAELKGEDRG